MCGLFFVNQGYLRICYSLPFLSLHHLVSSYLIAFSHHTLITLSPCHLFTRITSTPCHPIALIGFSPRHHITLLPYHFITLILALIVPSSSSLSSSRPHPCLLPRPLPSPYTPEYSLSWTLHSSLSGPPFSRLLS